MSEANRCPVCQARFRGARVCSRCGADLGPLMLLAAEAWKLREAARRALLAGNWKTALRLAEDAGRVQRTPAGESLRLLSEWWGSRERG